MTDLEILNSLRNGQHDRALDKLYEGYPAIKNFILKHGGTEDDSKDVFQESLVIFFQKTQNEEFYLTCKISTYLFSICKYSWKDHLKTNHKYIQHSDFNDSIVEIETETVMGNDHTEQLTIILDQLGDKCKSILEAYYSFKMNMSQIATKFNYSTVASAKNQKYKCLERAKKMALDLQNQLSN